MHNHTSLYLSYSFGAFVIVRKHVHKLEDEHPGDFSIVSPPPLASSRISKPRALSGETQRAAIATISKLAVFCV